MIVTVTPNPALDYGLAVQQLYAGRLHRAAADELRPGGKGVNVAIMVHRFGAGVRADGFTAGATGQILTRLLADQGVACGFITLDQGLTRINVKIMSEEGTATEINGPGPQVPGPAWSALADQLSGLSDEDTLVLCGAPPAGAPAQVYAGLAERAASRGTRLVVDVPAPWLQPLLAYHPFLVKPNVAELAETFCPGATDLDEDEIIRCARLAQEQGAGHVLVSRGADGAVLLAASGELVWARPEPGPVANPVGAGDSALAGFLAAWDRTHDLAVATGWAVAAGTATARQPWLASAGQVAQEVRQVRVDAR